MRRLVKFALAVVALCLVAVAVVFFLFPGVLVSATQWQATRAAGLSEKTVVIDGYEAHYYEGGEGPILVLLHGMADDKNSFVPTAGELTNTYRVILPDLLGHGDNAREAGHDYSITGQRTFFTKFAQALSLESFALGGNSMGGHVSAAFAIDQPEAVDHLVLVNAPGLVLDDHVVYGGFGAPLESEEDFQALMARVVYDPPALPGPIVRHMIADTNARMEFINGLAEAVRTGPEHDLKDRIAEITVPTLILWGQHDVVVKFNVAEAYDAGIPNSELVVLENAAHSPQLEIPIRIAQEIRGFVER